MAAPEGLGLSDKRDTAPRRAEDLTSTDGMPWQVRAIALIGVPAAIACFLVWLLAGNTSEALGRIETTLKPHALATEQLGHTLEALEQDHHESNSRIEGYMRLMCVQQAKTETQRNACLAVQ